MVTMSWKMRGESRNADFGSLLAYRGCVLATSTPASAAQRATGPATIQRHRNGMKTDAVSDAVIKNHFCVLTQAAKSKALARQRVQGILGDGAPYMSGPEEFPC